VLCDAQNKAMEYEMLLKDETAARQTLDTVRFLVSSASVVCFACLLLRSRADDPAHGCAPVAFVAVAVSVECATAAAVFAQVLALSLPR
jgi:hypothetical protein